MRLAFALTFAALFPYLFLTAIVPRVIRLGDRISSPVASEVCPD